MSASNEEYLQMEARHAQLVEEREQVLNTARDFRTKALEAILMPEHIQHHVVTLPNALEHYFCRCTGSCRMRGSRRLP